MNNRNAKRKDAKSNCVYMNWLVRMSPLLISDLLFVKWPSCHHCPNSMSANDVTDSHSKRWCWPFVPTICPSLIWKRTEMALKIWTFLMLGNEWIYMTAVARIKMSDNTRNKIRIDALSMSKIRLIDGRLAKKIREENALNGVSRI